MSKMAWARKTGIDRPILSSKAPTATLFLKILSQKLFFSPNRVLSVGVLAAKIAPMGGTSEVGRRITVVFTMVRGHDLTHSAAVSLAIFVSL